MMNEFNEQIPIPTSIEGSPARGELIPPELPAIALRDLVVFPGLMMPIPVGRERSIRALEEAINRGRLIFLVAQRNFEIEDPDPSDLYDVGTVCHITQILRIPGGIVRMMVEGLKRARVVEFSRIEPYFLARIEVLEEPEPPNGLEAEAFKRAAIEKFDRLAELSKKIPPEAVQGAAQADSPGRAADLIAAYLPVKVEEKQDLLATLDPVQRLEKLNLILNREIQLHELQREIEGRVKQEISESQREYFLREQLRIIQEQLGERDSRMEEIEEYREKIKKAKMPKEAEEKALQELARLERMPPPSPECAVIRTYLDWLCSLPWSKRTRDNLNLDRARRILDEDHYGLEKVKERVLEFLAVRKLHKKPKGPILAFIGPPGTGKTSIGRSIAKALGRKFIRISLGGIRDEAEIRGHRRTYVGALPGRIIQGIKRAGTKNPVFMMDEIDKIGVDFRGDPSAALLEALDPEQNYAFSDHYIEVPFDLSEVLFILTGNTLETVPPALKDRLEVIEFPGYTEEEKLQIALRHLIPKQKRENGIAKANFDFTEEAILYIIRRYTREAGVRNLERAIASICRKVAKEIASGRKPPRKITEREVEAFLGAPKYRYGEAEERDEVGVATGLAWTETGGDIIRVEVQLLEGSGKLLLTGRMGEVMKESAQAALSYVRAKARDLGADPKFYERTDVHIHVPELASPKEGPSAGVTIATALASALSKRPVRKDVAMTGEITLRGRVLPIGGVKEKVLAAHRAGIKTIVLPKENEKEVLDEIPEYVRKDLNFKFVDHMDEVLSIALV